DLVHALPAVAALAEAHPDADVDWLVDRRHRPVLDLFAVRARPVEIDGTSPSRMLAAARDLRARRYDIALDFQGLIKSAVLARASGAVRVVGFARHALREPMAATLYS